MNLRSMLLATKEHGVHPRAKAINRIKETLENVFSLLNPDVALLELFEPIFVRTAKNEHRFYDIAEALEMLNPANELGALKIVVEPEHEIEAIYLAMQGYHDIGGRGARLFVTPLNAYRSIGTEGTGLRMIYMQWNPTMEKYMYIDATYTFTDKDMKVKTITIDFDREIPEEYVYA